MVALLTQCHLVTRACIFNSLLSGCSLQLRHSLLRMQNKAL
jgi:hypothetical protein